MLIEVSEQTAEAIKKLDDRYFFDLFKSIRADEDEEYLFRDAVSEIVKAIQDTKGKKS